MYHQIGIQKLSHSQILKLLKGDRIRVKHGSNHTIHASQEQHKKIMACHKKGKGCTIQFDPFQTQMEEHHGLKHFGSVKKEGEGWFGDLAKGAFKKLAPHAIDFIGDEVKKGINGLGEGEGLARAQPLKKRGRPRKVIEGGDAFTDAFKSIGQIFTPAGLNSLKDTFSPNTTINGVKNLGKNLQSLSIPKMFNENQQRMITMANQKGFIQNHPYFLQNHPNIASQIKGRGLKHKKSNGGALFPAGYKKEHGEGSKSKIGRPRKCKGSKCEGDGFFGSILGGIAGDLLPF